MWTWNESTIEPLHYNDGIMLYQTKDQKSGLFRYFKAPRSDFDAEEILHQLELDFHLSRKLEHAGVWQPDQLLERNGTPVLLMKHLEGKPLASFLNDGPMELDLFIHIATGALDALSQLHRANYVHLALSPHAFFVESNRKKCKLTNLHHAVPITNYSGTPERTYPAISGEMLYYAAPELSGRIGRRHDERTDIYAIGVLFYRLLSGIHPFEGEDSGKLIHGHLAKMPKPLTEFGVPKPISNLILKCLSKHPEHRHSSAFALRCELESVLNRLMTEGYLEEFSIGSSSITDQFVIPETMYGREGELHALQQAYNRARNGTYELTFISGMSGIGKSYLIHEFQKSIQHQRSLFLYGKFDQFRRDTPYYAIHQAGKQLLQHMLTLDPQEFQKYRQRILDAVGPNGQILLDMNPELEAVLGQQPPLPKLLPGEMQNRFLWTIHQYISVFSTQDHPLVFFLDDLQWADAASIQLLNDMLFTSNIHHCLFIGSYRDRDVHGSHPLRAVLDKVHRSISSDRVSLIHLEPLDEEHLERMLFDTLRPTKRPIRELVHQIMSKTKGNPFFTKQFFRSLYDQKLLYFDYEQGGWQWDNDSITQLHITDNVADFMINKINRLPEQLQQLLMYGACIGQQFRLETLELITGMDGSAIQKILIQATYDGLLHSIPGGRLDETLDITYKFLHDRIYQAVYSLVPDKRKKELHLQIGRILDQYYSKQGKQEEYAFDIASQLNLGISEINSPQEKLHLALLNLQACRHAKLKSAYETGMHFALHGHALLNEDSWESNYELTFSLQLEKAELEYLCGRFEEAKHSFASALLHARTRLEKADTYNRMMVLYTNMNDHEEALRIGIEGLRMFGIRIYANVGKFSIGFELAKSLMLKGFRSPDDLMDIPVMTEPEHLAVMRFLENLIAPAYFLNSELYVYLMLLMFNYTLMNGHSEGSAIAFSTYGVIMSSVLGRLQSGYEYAKLSIQLSDTFHHQSFKSKVYFGAGAFTSHMKEYIAKNVEYLRKAHQIGVESGDFVYAGYSIAFSFLLRLLMGNPIYDVLRESQQYQGFIHKAQDRDTLQILNVLQRYMLHLKEASGPNLQFEPKGARSEFFISEEEAKQLPEYANKAIVHTYYLLQLQTLYLFDHLQEAKKMGDEAESTLTSMFGLPFIHLHHFHYALVLAGIFDKASPAEQKKYLDRINLSIRFLVKWAKHSPDNFSFMEMLLEAEWHRITDNRTLAEELYDQAIHCAIKYRFFNYAALANECAAKYYLRSGKLKIAKSYLLEARSFYTKWGAERKVADLDERYPYWMRQAQANPMTIDVPSVVKASQAIASDPAFIQMLDNIMTLLLENAGAEKALLALNNGQQLLLEAEKSLQSPLEAMHGKPIEDCMNAAITVMQYVSRTGETVLLDDAVQSELFAKDAYIQTKRPQSILCVPIIRLNKQVGILYLENNLAAHVFFEDRLETLKLLASEIAVLVENAKLHDHLKSKDSMLQLMEEQEKSIRHQLDEKERSVQSSEATMHLIRKAQHDLINNFQTVQGLLMMNKFEMAKEYIAAHSIEVDLPPITLAVCYPALNIVLNHILLACITEKIELQISGRADCKFDRLNLPECCFASIVHNVLINAVEAVPKDVTQRLVRLTIEENEQQYTLIVFNSGSYIPFERQHRIYDKGYTTKKDSSRSGLGLYIVQDCMQHYGGQIECLSDLDSGTSFIIHLPKAVVSPESESVPASDPGSE